MNCPTCNTKMTFLSESETLVGFPYHTDDQGREHEHNDNCLKRRYKCATCNTIHIESLRRTCTIPGCDWKGKTSCFCHSGTKVEHWTEGDPLAP